MLTCRRVSKTQLKSYDSCFISSNKHYVWVRDNARFEITEFKVARFYCMYHLSIQTLQQLRFHSVSRSPDVRSRYFTKEGNAFLSFVWTLRNAFGTRSEHVWDANGTRSERKWNANTVLGYF